MKNIIEKAWEDRSLLEESNTQNIIQKVISQLDEGKLRVAKPTSIGWKVNEWVKKAVVLYFPIQKMETLEAGPLEFHDKDLIDQISATLILQSYLDYKKNIL